MLLFTVSKEIFKCGALINLIAIDLILCFNICAKSGLGAPLLNVNYVDVASLLQLYIVSTGLLINK